MKINSVKNKLITLTAGVLAVLLISCASSKAVEKNDAYYMENKKTFSYKQLSNGIPVIFKKTAGGEIFVLRMVFDGGTPLIPAQKAGLEELTMDLMFHGSRNFPYEDIQNMQFNKSFSMNNSSGRDYSVAGIKCLKKDLDSVLSVFADAIINPALSQKDFDQFMINSRESLASSLSKPDSQLSIELEKAAFTGTAYESSTDITEESINSITLEDVKTHWKKLLDAKRIKFVVVADLNEDEQKVFVSKLDSYFGSLKKGDWKKPSVAKITVKGEDVYVANPQAGTAGYSIGFFDCPERYDTDYIPFAMCLLYLDDIFFKEVREKAGAVYSINTGVLGGRDMLGAISCFKISDVKNIRMHVERAIDLFPDTQEIEAKLDQYKNKYITTLFGSAQSGTGVAANIINSLEYSEDAETYLKRSQQVQQVQAKEITEAYKKYLAQNPKKAGKPVNKIRWVTVSAENPQNQ